MMKNRYSALLASSTLVFGLAVSAFGAVGEAQRIERLKMLADIWGKLYLFHPRIVTSNIDWNQVLVETIPKVEGAADADELVAVLNNSLFRPLDDQLTSAQKNEPVVPGPVRKLTARQLSGSIGYIDATDPREYGTDPASRIEELVRSLGPIKALIVDLRFAVPQSASCQWLQVFLDSPQTSGGHVSRVHEGWTERNTKGGYHQRWNVLPGSSFRPIRKTPSFQVPTVFIVNNSSYFRTAEVLDVLQATSGSAVILEGRGGFTQSFHDEYPDDVGVRLTAQYPENVEVQLYTSMLLSKSGNLGPQPDYATSDPITENQLSPLAGRLLEERKSRGPLHPFSFAMNLPDPEPISSEPVSRERRLHGLFKMWNVISCMNPHMGNASIDWSSALREWIPKVEAAKDLVDYYNVLRRLGARLNDTHVRIIAPNPSTRLPGLLPITLRPIEGKPVVVATAKGPSGEDLPIRAGDEILAIGGKSVEEIFTERRPLISASTPGAMLRNLVVSLNRVGNWPDVIGEDPLATEVLFQNDTGKHKITLRTIPPAGFVTAKDGTFQRTTPPKSPPSYKILESGLGYINLGTMTDAEKEPALNTVSATKGLILDMRGYPQVSFSWKLALLFVNKPIHSQFWEIPVVSMSSPVTFRRTATESFVWFEPRPAKPYTKPLVVLIDARAQSSAEAFCMYLRGDRLATFVGSTTAGTNGDGTNVSLPGGQKMFFTGMRIKFADGSSFQNIGIIPDVKAEPTIRGIRAGRDEVLEKGVEAMKALIAR